MASELDVDAALRLADEAFQTYRQTTGEARAAFLERIGDEIMAIGDVLIARAHVHARRAFGDTRARLFVGAYGSSF